MREQDVRAVMADPLARELMAAALPARFAYNGLDGLPRVVPVGFHWNGTHLIVCTATKAPKVAALRERPHVALTIDTEGLPPHVLLVRGTAAVEIVDGVPDEYLEASRKVIAAENWPGFEANVRAMYPRMARVAVTPTWARIHDFVTRLPSVIENAALRA